MKENIKIILVFCLLTISIGVFSREGNILQKTIVSSTNQFTVLDIYRIVNENNSNLQGLHFIFLISSTSQTEELPAVTELRDFLVDGLSYREYSKDALGEYIEPESVIYNVDDFIREHRPDLEIFAKESQNKAVIMTAEIYGAALPDEAEIVVNVSVGWVPSSTPYASTPSYKLRSYTQDFNEVFLFDSNSQ